MNVHVCARKWSWHIEVNISKFAWKDWRKPKTASPRFEHGISWVQISQCCCEQHSGTGQDIQLSLQRYRDKQTDIHTVTDSAGNTAIDVMSRTVMPVMRSSELGWTHGRPYCSYSRYWSVCRGKWRDTGVKLQHNLFPTISFPIPYSLLTYHSTLYWATDSVVKQRINQYKMSAAKW